MHTHSLPVEQDINFKKSRVSWGAIFAGTIIILITSFLLNLLGIGLGLSAFTFDSDVMSTIGIGTVIWLVVSGIISVFVGTFITGKLINSLQPADGVLHGLVTWGGAMLVMLFLMVTTAGGLLSGTMSVVGQSLKIAGKSAAYVGKAAANTAPQLASVAQNVMPDLAPAVSRIQQQASQVFNQAAQNLQNTSSQSINQMQQQLTQYISALLSAQNNNDFNNAKQQLTNFMVNSLGIDQQQAEQTINSWVQQFNQFKAQINQKAQSAKQQTMAATEKATNTMGIIANLAFIVLVFGVITAAIGGFLGTKYNRQLNVVRV